MYLVHRCLTEYKGTAGAILESLSKDFQNYLADQIDRKSGLKMGSFHSGNWSTYVLCVT